MGSREDMAERRTFFRSAGLRRIVLGLLVLLAVAYFVWGALRDLALELGAGRISKGIPDSILENISVEREIDAGTVKGYVGKIERGKDWAVLFDLDGELLMRNGQRWTLKAPTGRYFDEKREADLTEPTGTMAGEGFLFDYGAPVASWSHASGRIVFPRGFRAWGPQGTLEATHMEVLPEGVAEASRGAVITWAENKGEGR